MSAMPVTFYQANCDTCGGLYDGEDDGSAFEARSDALGVAESCGWLRDGEKLICPNCLRCARCDEHPAWVGGAGLTMRHSQILCEDCEPGPARIAAQQ